MPNSGTAANGASRRSIKSVCEALNRKKFVIERPGAKSRLFGSAAEVRGRREIPILKFISRPDLHAKCDELPANCTQELPQLHSGISYGLRMFIPSSGIGKDPKIHHHERHELHHKCRTTEAYLAAILQPFRRRRPDPGTNARSNVPLEKMTR